MRSSHSFFKPSPVVVNQPVATIRRATEQDAEDIARVAIRTYVETYGEDTREKTESLYGPDYIHNIFPAFLVDKNNIIAVLQWGSHIIGFAKLIMQDDGVALLDKLYVLKAHHQKGHGKNLLQFCYEEALASGSTQGKLCVYEHNDTAIAFYQKHGFTVTGEREEYLLPDGKRSGVESLVMRADIDNIIMRKQLAVMRLSQA